jgi:2-oxoisovalerate dehydrogenase E1 component
MYGGTTDLPLVARTRIATGCGYGGQHSMDPAALFALFPGWRIVAPSNAFDYIGLFNTAMRSRDPVLVIEHHSLYAMEFPVPPDALDFCVPFGRARVLHAGADVTVLAYGAMAGRVREAVPELEAAGVSAELIDLRTLDLPGLDRAAICASVAKTGALVVVEEAPSSQSLGPRIVSEALAGVFDALDCPPVCLCSRDVPPPVSRVLEKAMILGREEIVRGIARAARREA